MAWTDVVSRLFNRSSNNISADLMGEGETYWWGNSLSGALNSLPGAGIKFNHDQAMTVSTVFACTRARAEILASLPGMVYLELPDHTRRRHSDNDLWRMLHDCPNPEMDSMVMYELIQTRHVNRGNGFAIIERDNRDLPMHLWPVHNSRVEPYRDTNDGSLNWRIYTDSFDPRAEKFRAVSVPDRNMLNIVGFGGNGYIGKGVIENAVEEISLNMAMTQYGAKFFKQGGRPIGVVEHPGWIDDDDKRKIYTGDINTLHSTAENWHKVATLWMGAKWKELQFSPQDSQFIAGRDYSGKQLCQFYNVPPAIVQIFESYKFNTVDAMIQQFVMTCVRSDAIRFERAINRKVIQTTDSAGRMVDLFDDPFVFEFVIEALLRGDTKKQAEVLEIERRNGIINSNKWLALSNREPLPGDQGEKYVLPGGFEDLATLGQNRDGDTSAFDSSPSNLNAVDAIDAEFQVEGLPKFDREFVAQRLESGVPKHHNRGLGGSAADATTLRDELDKVAVEVLQEAISRIESVLTNELARAEKIPDEAARSAKMEAVWQKHFGRLESAIQPACEIFCRYRNEENSSDVARCLSSHLVRIRSTNTKVDLEMFAQREE